MSTETNPTIRLSVPADTASLQIVRLNVAAVAGALDFDVDEVDDLKLAVEELSAWLLGLPLDGDRLEVDIHQHGEAVRVEGRRSGESPDASLGDYLPVILGAVVDEFATESDAASVVFRMQKQRAGG